jgi:enoyl-CoA hydratase/methylglutaconyl-CoA hydratase
MTELVHYEVADRIATVTLDSPHNRNALSRQLVTELFESLRRAEEDGTVHVVLLRSADRVFCSGADLSEAAGGSMEEGARALVDLQRTIATMAKPVITRIAGPVRAGGIGIVAASDIAIAVEAASFAFTEVKLALTPAVISLTVLPRMTSRSGALTFLTGEQFDATAASEMGLITKVVSADALDEVVDALCAGLAASPLQGLRETKRLLTRGLVENIDVHGDDVATLSARLFGSDAARDAMLAFLSK